MNSASSLTPGSTPYAITTPRRVALPLMPKVKEELQRMEKLGVISKVDIPTDWYAGMVVVPKPDGRIRICIDLTKLNESVLRETYPLPKIDNLLVQISEGCPIHTNGVGSTFRCRRPVKRKSGRRVCGSKVTGSCYLKEGFQIATF